MSTASYVDNEGIEESHDKFQPQIQDANERKREINRALRNNVSREKDGNILLI